MAQHDDKKQERMLRELSKYETLDTSEIDQVIQQLIVDPKGQKFLWWLLQISKYGVNPFSPDASVMAFQAGEANIGAQILARIVEVNPLGFAELQITRKKESDARYRAASSLAAGDDLFADSDDADDS